MVANEALDPIMERLIRAWHDVEAIRDMPELFTEEKLAQIAGAAMAAIEEAWQAFCNCVVRLHRRDDREGVITAARPQSNSEYRKSLSCIQ